MVEISGAVLEARAHRIFLAQGSFAERGLLPAATADRRMLATDIDVLVSEYGSGFHLTRRHVECKSGKFKLVDRILWLNGVRTLLRANSSYLIAADVDLSASNFARRLDVQLFSGQHLDAWERALRIPLDSWPCRSDYATFDTATREWKRFGNDRKNDIWRLLREALVFVEVESWLTFRYRRLNKLFRLIREISKAYVSEGLDDHQRLCARYSFSALLVRLSQYVLSICADVASIVPLQVEDYLSDRLKFGDQDPKQATDMMEATVKWVRESLRFKGVKVPPEIDTDRLQPTPRYTAELVSLIRCLLDQSQEARYLPLAIERMQFGLEADDELPRYRAAAVSGDSLAVLLKGFVGRMFRAPNALAMPVREDLMKAYTPSAAVRVPVSTSVGPTVSKRSDLKRGSEYSGRYPPNSGRQPASVQPPVRGPVGASGEESAGSGAARSSGSSQGTLPNMQTEEKK